jgi:hypothetical protein
MIPPLVVFPFPHKIREGVDEGWIVFPIPPAINPFSLPLIWFPAPHRISPSGDKALFPFPPNTTLLGAIASLLFPPPIKLVAVHEFVLPTVNAPEASNTGEDVLGSAVKVVCT